MHILLGNTKFIRTSLINRKTSGSLMGAKTCIFDDNERIVCLYCNAMYATTTKFSQKCKSIEQISYSVYTVRFPFHKCLLRFALHKKEGTERLHVR